MRETLLGQGRLLQACTSTSAPLHLLPPCRGGGLLHVRDRLCVPPPHVTSHCDHSFQSVQLPSTMKKSGVVIKTWTRCFKQLVWKIRVLCTNRASFGFTVKIHLEPLGEHYQNSGCVWAMNVFIFVAAFAGCCRFCVRLLLLLIL